MFTSSDWVAIFYYFSQCVVFFVKKNNNKLGRRSVKKTVTTTDDSCISIVVAKHTHTHTNTTVVVLIRQSYRFVWLSWIAIVKQEIYIQDKPLSSSSSTFPYVKMISVTIQRCVCVYVKYLTKECWLYTLNKYRDFQTKHKRWQSDQ